MKSVIKETKPNLKSSTQVTPLSSFVLGFDREQLINVASTRAQFRSPTPFLGSAITIDPMNKEFGKVSVRSPLLSSWFRMIQAFSPWISFPPLIDTKSFSKFPNAVSSAPQVNEIPEHPLNSMSDSFKEVYNPMETNTVLFIKFPFTLVIYRLNQ